MRPLLVVFGILFALDAGAATLHWTPPDNVASGEVNLNGYRIYIGSTETPTAEVGADVLSYDLGDLTPGEQITIGISAFNDAGESGLLMITTIPPVDKRPPNPVPTFDIQWKVERDSDAQ